MQSSRAACLDGINHRHVVEERDDADGEVVVAQPPSRDLVLARLTHLHARRAVVRRVAARLASAQAQLLAATLLRPADAGQLAYALNTHAIVASLESPPASTQCADSIACAAEEEQEKRAFLLRSSMSPGMRSLCSRGPAAALPGPLSSLRSRLVTQLSMLRTSLRFFFATALTTRSAASGSRSAAREAGWFSGGCLLGTLEVASGVLAGGGWGTAPWGACR
jgi:hypothetical protein